MRSSCRFIDLLGPDEDEGLYRSAKVSETLGWQTISTQGTKPIHMVAMAKGPRPLRPVVILGVGPKGEEGSDLSLSEGYPRRSSIEDSLNKTERSGAGPQGSTTGPATTERTRQFFGVAERTKEVVEQRRVRLSWLREKHQLDKELTFNPRINPQSQKMAESLRGVEARTSRGRPGSASASFSLTQIFSNFNQKGIVGGKSSETMRSSPRLRKAKPNDSLTFLYDIPVQKQKEKARFLQALHSDRKTFVPRIDPVSRKIAERRPRDSGLTDRGLARADRDAVARETRELAECSFAPRINRNFEDVASNFRVDRLDESLQQHQRKLSEKEELRRKSQEFYQVRDCTFRPRINSSVLNHSGKLHEVPGIYNYFRKIERYLKLKAAKNPKEPLVTQQENKINLSGYVRNPSSSRGLR